MSQEFRRVSAEDLNDQLRGVVESRLLAVISNRRPGHCMRVGDLDRAVMLDVARNLQSTLGANARIYVLAHEIQQDNALLITSSKLVELRNPPAEDVQRPPLLIFVPNDLRTAAEDSFAEATFEQVPVVEAYADLRAQLLQQLPESLRSAVSEVIRLLEERAWRWADAVAVARFLLCIKINGAEAEVVGAALSELGLAPDFCLLDDLANAPHRLIKNLDCVEKLTFSTKSERGRVLNLKLKDPVFRGKLSDFLCESGLEDPMTWTRRIVVEKPLWALSFDKWQFEDGSGFTQQLRVEVLDVSLPVIEDNETDPRLLQLIGQQVLLIGKKGPKSFKVRFRCDPTPGNIPGVDHFRLQLIARESGPTAFTKKKTSWDGPRRDASVSFSKLGAVEWDDGWHFVRVLPCTAEGDPIPIVDADGQPIPLVGSTEGGQGLNESDLFYVVVADDVEVDVPQRAIPKFPSYNHALVHFWFKAAGEGNDPHAVTCTHRAWIDGDDSKGKVEVLELKFAGEGLAHVSVSRVLKVLEQQALAASDDSLSWRLSISSAQTAEVFKDISTWPELSGIDEFRATRRELFAKFRGEDGQYVIQSTDLFPLRELIATYAEQYLSVLSQVLRNAEAAPIDQQPQILAQLQKLLVLDTAQIDLADHRGAHRAALLVGPSHPLRLLWLATWLTVAQFWLERARQAPKGYLIPTRDSLLERLSLVNFPSVFPMGSGQLLSAVDNLHPLWTVYASPSESDPRGLMAEICTALGLPEPNVGSFMLNGRFLAERVRRYLVQHPYIQTLVLNCFNAGRGRLLAEMLLELQQEPDLSDLRYNIRVFVPDPDAPGVGEDLNELISPSSTLTVAEADAFATPTGNHLAPKLTFSVRDILEFRNGASEFPAHLSMLFDIFPAQNVNAQAPRQEDKNAPVHGLLQDFVVNYVEEAELVAWHRRPRHGFAIPIPEASEYPTLLARLAETISTAAAAVGIGQTGLIMQPVFTLALEADQKALLHQVHDISDWVFTIDKSLGIEFFDHNPASRRPEYLIDHSPDLSANSGRRVVITSRSQTEIRVLFERVLDDYGLSAFKNRAHALLGELRGLSGRLALKLASSLTHRAEALGLALAKLYLEYQDAFRDQAVVPLDAHLDLYRALQAKADELQDEISLRRTDLGLFDFDAKNRVLTCSLVEVKCYRAAGSLEGLNQLKQSIAEQIQQSERTLRYHFDPDLGGAVDRPDRVMKTHEFINLLEFYVDRAHRLNLLTPEACEEAKFLLRTMEGGYSLRFTRSALIFDFDKDGAEEFVEENGIEFHRIGVDLISKLLEALPAKREEEETLPQPLPVAEAPREDEFSTMQRLVGQLPKVGRAAFLRERRDRTVSWETVGSLSKGAQLMAPVSEERIPVAPHRPRMESVSQAEALMPSKTVEPSATPASKEPSPIVPPVQTQNLAGQPQDNLKPLPPPVTALAVDVVLGATESSPQFGILGKVMGRTVALDLNQTHTVSLFGVQGGGKSYTLGSIIEMASLQLPGLNCLPRPLATVVFHYSQTQDYKPEFTTVNQANDDVKDLATLAREYNAHPAALKDVVLLVPSAKMEARRAEYPDIEIQPLKFASSELQAAHWRFLMGAVGNQATYIRKLNQIMRTLRDNLTLSGLRQAIQAAGLPDNLKDLASLRLDLAAEYIDDAVCLSKVIRPGRLVIVDLRDEFIEKDEALGLFVVLLQLFADATYDGKPFNKLVVFDEAHKYIDSPDLVEGMIGVVREMRHKGTSVLVASQDPPSVPVSLIELSSQIILHRFNSPAWLKHIQKANAALTSLSPEQLARLNTGEAYVWSSKATDPTFSHEAVKIVCRPRATKHGGTSKVAVGK